MKKITVTDETSKNLETYLTEILIEIKESDEVFSHKVIEGLTLCLEELLVNSLANNKKNNYFKEFVTDLKTVLLESIAMKQKRALYKKTKAENISDFFEISIGALSQMVGKKEVEYYPFIKQKNSFEIGVKEYCEDFDEYLIDLKDSYSQSRNNIKI